MGLNGSLVIALGEATDLDPFIALLEEAADWLWRRGLRFAELGNAPSQGFFVRLFELRVGGERRRRVSSRQC